MLTIHISVLLTLFPNHQRRLLQFSNYLLHHNHFLCKLDHIYICRRYLVRAVAIQLLNLSCHCTPTSTLKLFHSRRLIKIPLVLLIMLYINILCIICYRDDRRLMCLRRQILQLRALRHKVQPRQLCKLLVHTRYLILESTLCTNQSFDKACLYTHEVTLLTNTLRRLDRINYMFLGLKRKATQALIATPINFKSTHVRNSRINRLDLTPINQPQEIHLEDYSPHFGWKKKEDGLVCFRCTHMWSNKHFMNGKLESAWKPRERCGQELRFGDRHCKHLVAAIQQRLHT